MAHNHRSLTFISSSSTQTVQVEINYWCNYFICYVGKIKKKKKTQITVLLNKAQGDDLLVICFMLTSTKHICPTKNSLNTQLTLYIKRCPNSEHCDYAIIQNKPVFLHNFCYLNNAVCYIYSTLLVASLFYMLILVTVINFELKSII